MSPYTFHPQHVAHNTSPTTRCPQHIHTSPTTCCPQHIPKSPTTCCPQHIPTSPTTCCPQYVSHNTLTRCPQYIVHAFVEESDLDISSEEEESDKEGLHYYCGSKTIKLSSHITPNSASMNRLLRGCRGMHRTHDNIHHDVWDSVLCEAVPISLREMVSLGAVHLGLPDTEVIRKRLLSCSWTLGYHVTSTDSLGLSSHYWGGGLTPNTTSSLKRGDWIEIEGTELFRGVQTSRLGRVICGVLIRNIDQVFGHEINDEVWENDSCQKADYVVFLLVRYAMPHPAVARQRGPEYRPLCPGDLKDTHCLWKWYQRPANFRRGCWRARPWQRHKHFFGDTDEQQNKRKADEARAWYDFVQCSNISCHTNVKKDWDRPDSFLQSVMWC